ncbi:MAG: 2-amino-4-hydroxy-6-hydroxymethyldihydropteridine diphosphokinase [Gammaproteobacteria bacterium]|nr:2-amino-4-hydroxy-6-hydroxymethyldihydropteridine diphosphokinase [Gammaproteobacteria bacterium]
MATSTVEVFIGLGSNARPVGHLKHACLALGEVLEDMRASEVYASEAIGGGAAYLNMVVRGRTTLAPEALIATLKTIEQATGRVRGQPEVTLDLDLLCYGDLVSAPLRLPRRDVLEYAFVLRPLADLAPDHRHPLTGQRFVEHWREAAAGMADLTRRGRLETLAEAPGAHGDER